MERGRKKRTVKDTANKVTIHQFYKGTRSGRTKVRYNPLKEGDELTSNL